MKNILAANSMKKRNRGGGTAIAWVGHFMELLEARLLRPASDRGFREALFARLFCVLPSGGSLPDEVWRKRHSFLLALTWLHALVISAVGLLLGYSRDLSVRAFFEDETVLHTIGEAFVVGLFAAIAGFARLPRQVKATAVGFGLMSASAIFVHLSGGYIELHFHFFVIVAFLALYQDWVPYLLSIFFVAVHHGTVGIFRPEQVYNHPAAIEAPWTWASIHAGFVLMAAAASVIAWRFNERSAAQTSLILQACGEGIFGVDLKGKVTFINPVAAKLMGVPIEHALGGFVRRLHDGRLERHSPALISMIIDSLSDGSPRQASGVMLSGSGGAIRVVDCAANPIVERRKMSGLVVTLNDVSKHKEAEDAVRTIAAEKTKLLEQTEQRAQEQAALNSVAKAVSQSLRREELLDFALGKTLEVTGRERVSIRLKDPATGQVKLVAHRGFLPEEVYALERRVVHGPSDRVLNSGEPIVVDNRADVPNVQLLPHSVSVAWIPIKAGAEVIGIMGVSATSAVPVTNREVEFLQAIGNMLGVALQNATLFADVEARYREFKVLHSVSESILESSDLNIVMHGILEQLFEVGKFDIGVIRVFDSSNEILKTVASRGYRNPNNAFEHRKQLDGYTGKLARQAMVTQEIRIVDLSTTSGMQTFRKEGIATAILVPLRTADEILGVIQLGCRGKREFYPAELHILEAIGRQTGIAVQKSRLQEENKKAQEALAEKANELARSNTELQQFAYVASHDLQEPLRMVASYVQLLARRYKGKLDGDADEFIAFAADGATRMQSLINALLAYSRLGTKGRPFEPTNCEELLKTALQNLKIAVQESAALITHDPLPSVNGDATQLGQLFQNLIGNAIKFRGNKPPKIHVSANREVNRWHFYFRDEGIGIDPQFSERIFVIFQRLHSKEEYPGTGIGLALCKKIVERHGGEIWVESQMGNGATFHFTIPA